MCSPILNMPWNVLLKIFEHLSLYDIRNIMLTCRCLRDFVRSENALWRSLFHNRFVLHQCTARNTTNTTGWTGSSYKLTLYHQCMLTHNWVAGYYTKKTVISHRINYMPWLKYHNSEALFLSYGSKLSCYLTYGLSNRMSSTWNLQVPTVNRHDRRTNDISRFIIKNNYIACGNRDGCVALYQMDSLLAKPHLVRHIKDCHSSGRVEVSAVELLSAGGPMRVVTASECSTDVSLWDVLPTTEDTVLNGNQSTDDIRRSEIPDCLGVRCIASNETDDLLAIGPTGNSKLLLLDITTGVTLNRAERSRSAKEAVRDIVWIDHSLVTYATHAGKLNIIDRRTGVVVYSALDPFQATLYCVRSDGDRALLVGTSQHSRCVLFDVRNSRKHLQIYFTQKRASPVYSCDFDPINLIAAADRSIAVLNFDVYPSEVDCYDYSNPFL